MAMKKNPARRILRLRRVASNDIFHFAAVRSCPVVFFVMENFNEISYYTKKRHWLSLPVSPIKTIIFIFSQLPKKRNAGRMCPLRSQKTTQFTLLPESPE